MGRYWINEDFEDNYAIMGNLKHKRLSGIPWRDIILRKSLASIWHSIFFLQTAIFRKQHNMYQCTLAVNRSSSRRSANLPNTCELRFHSIPDHCCSCIERSCWTYTPRKPTHYRQWCYLAGRSLSLYKPKRRKELQLYLSQNCICSRVWLGPVMPNAVGYRLLDANTLFGVTKLSAANLQTRRHCCNIQD